MPTSTSASASRSPSTHRDGLCRAGRLHDHPRLLPEQRGVRRGLAREIEYARSAPTSTSASISAPRTRCTRGAGSTSREFGVTSFKYFMNFKGEEGRYLGLDGTDDGYLYDLLRSGGADRRRVTVVPHREHRAREPAPQAPSSPRAATRCATGRCPSRRSPRPRACVRADVLRRASRRAHLHPARLARSCARRGAALAQPLRPQSTSRPARTT